MECAPDDWYEDGWRVPVLNTNIEMTRVDEKTWKGYFFKDLLLDEDYFGKGICHWNADRVTINFIAHDEIYRVTASSDPNGQLDYMTETSYFEKSSYLNRALNGQSEIGLSSYNDLVTDHPDKYIPITVSVKEATP
jgi:hypothetical protein